MPKREVPSAVQLVLSFDKAVTSQICDVSERFAITRSIKKQGKSLEWSCHGIVWLAGWLFFIWFAWYPSWFQMQVNLYLALILDIIIVAVLKALTRRRRPVGNKGDVLSLGPDKFSFPSGHVSRAFLILYFFINLYPLNPIFHILLFIWCLAVAYSRILLRRHHLLDVIAGVMLGLFEGLLMSHIWLSKSSAMYLVSYITDERLEGAEYDV